MLKAIETYLALRRATIDAATFSSIRIVSGALALWLIMRIRNSEATDSGSWMSATALFGYVAAFTFAYNSLSAGTGALLLFAAVQSTMIIWGLTKGERLNFRQWSGFAIASAGLVLLVLPGLSAPPVAGSLLMLAAGIAWGVYSLRGKTEKHPVNSTAGNFFRAVPMTLLLTLACLPWARADLSGILYAIVSGAITSGIGYVIWYAALSGLKATSAATVQLSVPVLAATGGILLLAEPITPRYVLASFAVLGGIFLVVIEKPRTQ